MNNKINNEIKIAIVDDHELIRECLFNCLSLWGYQVVIQASNGKELLDQITKENLPHICILDLNMPVLNGYETLTILKKTWPSIKTIVFSMDIISGQPDYLVFADAVLSKSAGLTEMQSILQSVSMLNNKQNI